MLRNSMSLDFRFALQPLAWLTAGAVLAASSPVRAESADEGEAAFAGGDAHAADASLTAGDPRDDGSVAHAFATSSLPALLGTRFPLGATTVGTATAATGAPAPSAAPAPAPPAKDDGAGLRTAGYVAGGVGLVGFVLFAVAGLSAKNAHDRLDKACNSGSCNDASVQSDIENGKMMQTAANIGLATGLTGFGLGATLIVLGSQSRSDATASAGPLSPGGMVTYSGRF